MNVRFIPASTLCMFYCNYDNQGSVRIPVLRLWVVTEVRDKLQIWSFRLENLSSPSDATWVHASHIWKDKKCH